MTAKTHGRADIVLCSASGITQLKSLYQQSPLRVLFPYRRASEIKEIVIVNTSGGVVSGDQLETMVSAQDSANAFVTTQAAEKVYRSKGAVSLAQVTLDAKENSWLTWMPQETIVFEGARLRRATDLHVADGGRLLAGEVLVFGRIASGEKITGGLIHDEWRVYSEGRLVWADNLHLTGQIDSKLASSAGFNGAGAMATAVYTSDDASDWFDSIRDIVQTVECLAGATCIGNVVIARWLGRDASIVRQQYCRSIASIVSLIRGCPIQTSRIWNF